MYNSYMQRLIQGKFEQWDISDWQLPHPDSLDSIKLIFMDPPDNEGRAYDGYKDKLEDGLYAFFLRKWIRKACNLTNGPVFVSIAEKWVKEIEWLIGNGRIKLIRRLYWHYTFGQNNKNSYSPCMRPIYWLNDSTIYPKAIHIPSDRQKKYGDKRANPVGKIPSNVWEFPRICGTFKERREWHPTQHPEALIKRIILGHSKEGDLVLDPFVGSGTTALVCQDLGRSFIGIDQSELYISKVYEELKHRNG